MASYAAEWLKELPLDALNAKLHDGARTSDENLDRGRRYISTIAEDGKATVPEDANILDIGGGVGWPMQAALERFPTATVTDLDLSAVYLKQAQTRLESVNADMQRCRFVPYDGRTFPFPDSQFDLVYALSMIWHLPDVVMGNILREAIRVLKPGGTFIFNFIFFNGFVRTLDQQFEVQIKEKPGHHHYFRSAHTFASILADIGASDIDLFVKRYGWIVASKGGEEKFGSPEFAEAVVAVDRYARCHAVAE